MKKFTRLVLIGAVLATSGLTAKAVNKRLADYIAIAVNDERIQKATENMNSANKPEILNAILNATKETQSPGEHVRDAVILNSKDVPAFRLIRIKSKVTTSAGISPKSSAMTSKDSYNPEEFIEKKAVHVSVVTPDAQACSQDDMPNHVATHIQELTCEAKAVSPTIDEAEEAPLTYKITLPEICSMNNSEDFEEAGYVSVDKYYFFDVEGTGESDGSKLNCINYSRNGFGLICIWGYQINDNVLGEVTKNQEFAVSDDERDILIYNPVFRTLDYSRLAPFKDSNDPIPGDWDGDKVPTCKEVYNFLVGVEKGTYTLIEGVMQE